jgi:hypothetical protein
MKTIAKHILILLLIGSGNGLLTNNIQAHSWNCQESFYFELLPYGNWINTPGHGMVWVPAVNNGFHPYGSEGYWVYSVYGWTWVSYYSWGWIPFHYGRWYFDPWYGWSWVPGYEWGPGWVSWSHCDGYYGWAPLEPGFRFDRPVPPMHDFHVNLWVFVPSNHFGEPLQANHYLKSQDAERMHHRSSLISDIDTERGRNMRYFRGPEVKEVRKVTGRDFKSTVLREDQKSGDFSKREHSIRYDNSSNGIRSGYEHRDQINNSQAGERMQQASSSTRSTSHQYIYQTGAGQQEKSGNRTNRNEISPSGSSHIDRPGYNRQVNYKTRR